MIYRFGDYELDTAKVELRAGGAPAPLEPQVFALILFLLENRERVVSRDELIEQIWDGRIVSDAAVASRVKSARAALGDDGRAQRVIRTAHGVGFRFVAEVEAAPAVESVRELAPAPAFAEAEPSRPRIAVLPFRLVGVAGPDGAIADALPQDIITELSRLRWLFVIARASSFQFRGADADIARVRAALHVGYCLTGVVEVRGEAMKVSVELSDAEAGVVWSDRYELKAGGVHDVRAEIVRNIIGALELQIPLNEARRARLKSPERLDAWSAYHLGLQHMYRFTKADNKQAGLLFARAADLEPSFARAYAGLSFTSFQDAFLSYADDHDAAAGLAQTYAERALERDPLDPFSNFTMGRALWLRADLAGSLAWLDRANTLNPNYAQAQYSRAWAQGLMGQVAECRRDVDAAMALSPLDPLYYGMLGVRAFSHITAGETEEGAAWADRAAQAPGAHALIAMIAVVAHELNGDEARAHFWTEAARARAQDLSTAVFFRAFPFQDPAMRTRIAAALGKAGF